MKNNVIVANKKELVKVIEKININVANRISFKSHYIEVFTKRFGIEDEHKINLIIDDIESIIEAINTDATNKDAHSLIDDIVEVLASEDENDLELYNIAFRTVMGTDLNEFINQIGKDVLNNDNELTDVLSAEFSTMYLFYRANYESKVTPHGMIYIDKRINPSTLPDDYYSYDLVKCDSSSDLVIEPLLSTDPHDPLYFGSIISDEEIDLGTLVMRAVNLFDCLKFSIIDDTFIEID